MTSWQEVCFAAPQDSEHLTKQQCLDQLVVMSFPHFFVISNMERGQ